TISVPTSSPFSRKVVGAARRTACKNRAAANVRTVVEPSFGEAHGKRRCQLRAVVPGSRRPLLESHATRDAVDARRAALERAGYNVVVTLPDLSVEDEFLKLEARRTVGSAFRLRDPQTDF